MSEFSLTQFQSDGGAQCRTVQNSISCLRGWCVEAGHSQSCTSAEAVLDLHPLVPENILFQGN